MTPLTPDRSSSLRVAPRRQNYVYRKLSAQGSIPMLDLDIVHEEKFSNIDTNSFGSASSGEMNSQHISK